ncbi:hypothetical protein Vadar_015362 [Vaccinium darrowii]|uniref:Uncharacterized protein n=1 Tax=Vaccinium darrowii TaxID=229202 RepID=A0ACB7XA28_9ERIC|nr:hypothetical protein Vadar_015362 [Vaccinium darrowii]
MDEYLVDILYEHTIYRRQKDRSFTSTAYANASRAMSKKFGENISKEHIKDRLKTIMQIFNLAYDLVLEADPQKFCLRPIPKFDQLEAIFGKDRATGATAETPKEKKCRWEKSVMKETWTILMNS